MVGILNHLLGIFDVVPHCTLSNVTNWDEQNSLF